MLRRALETVLVAAFITCTLVPEALASNYYARIEKPWAISSLLEVLVITAAAIVLARRPRFAGLTLLATLGWGAVRVWLDPIFDPIMGIMMRNTELGLGMRVGYQLVLFGLAIAPLTAALVVSGRAGHFTTRRWRLAVAPSYLVIAAIVIISPEFMVLTVF